MKLPGRSMVGVSPSQTCGVLLRSYLIMLFISWLWLGSQAWGQSPAPPPSRLSVMSSQGDVPRQLTLEVAEQLLLQHNLAVVAARYGVGNARAQRLIASVRPNPTLTLGAEAFDLRSPGRHVFSNSDSASNRLYTMRI